MIILRNKIFSEKEPTIRRGHWRNKKKFSELTDKQLRNIANYENEKHPGYTRATLLSAATGGITGTMLGAAMPKWKVGKSALIGTGIGTLYGLGISAAGHNLHTKQVKYAKKELAKRNKNKE